MSECLRAVALAIAVAGCGVAMPPEPVLSACTEQQIGERSFGLVDLGESPTPKTAVRLAHDAGVTLVLTVARGDGRLFLQLHEPVSGGALPRDSSGPCPLPERILWRSLDDGRRYPATGVLSVLDGGAGPGQELAFVVRQLSFERDGGTALPDFEASVMIPR